MREGFARFLPVGITVAVFMIAAMGLVVSSDYFISDTYMPIKSIGLDYSNTKELGLTLYTQYLYQFEIAGAILLVAIVAAISLSMSKSKVNKSISPEQQVIVKKIDRLRVVKMKAEPNIKSREI